MNDFLAWLVSDVHVEAKDAALMSLWNSIDIKPTSATQRSFKEIKRTIAQSEARKPAAKAAGRLDTKNVAQSVDQPGQNSHRSSGKHSRQLASRDEYGVEKRWTLLHVAAVVLPVVIVCGIGYGVMTGKLELMVARVATIASPVQQDQPNEFVVAGEPKMVEVSTYAGINKTVALPDGSEVFLRGGSTIVYPEDFNNNRSVELTNEAYFKVADDSVHPFVVDVHGLTLRVLGTEFNVTANPAEDQISVILDKGRLEADVDDQKLVLREGMQLDYSKVSREFCIRKADGPVDRSWCSAALFFENATLNEIFSSLERYYNVKLEIKGKIPGGTFSTRFTGGESVEDVMGIISGLSGKFSYRIDNDKVKISVR
ncbi:hypothetical protein FACS1894159_05150 [Bacteroidia bacterium]|nr:hypothetical protein FACS1894159_05150 [Bacteroidia bacterium]